MNNMSATNTLDKIELEKRSRQIARCLYDAIAVTPADPHLSLDIFSGGGDSNKEISFKWPKTTAVPPAQRS
jgi:hypothetical protein